MTNTITANGFSELDSKEMLNVDGGMKVNQFVAGNVVMAASVIVACVPGCQGAAIGMAVGGFTAAASALDN